MSPNGKTVAQMLQQRKMQQTSQNSDNNDEIEEILEDDSNSSLAVVSESVRDVIESVAKGEDQHNGDEVNNKMNTSTNAGSDVEDDMYKRDNAAIPIVKLPNNLPAELNSIIDKIKKVIDTAR